MPRLRPRRLIRPPNPNRTMAPVKALGGSFVKANTPATLKRRPGPSTVFAPASLAEVGDLLLIADHNFLCRVVGRVKGYYVLVRSLRSGERFAFPLNLQIELFNTPRR